jgi:hypothetical protein
VFTRLALNQFGRSAELFREFHHCLFRVKVFGLFSEIKALFSLFPIFLRRRPPPSLAPHLDKRRGDIPFLNPKRFYSVFKLYVPACSIAQTHGAGFQLSVGIDAEKIGVLAPASADPSTSYSASPSLQ